MSTNLSSAIQQLTEAFTNNLIAVVRRRPTAPASREQQRRRRTETADFLAGRRRTLPRWVDKIAGLLVKNKDGLRSEQIRDALKVQAKELPRPLADGLKARRFTSKGEKRATTYFAAKKAPAKKPAKKKS
jgi:hypothetical protein